MSTWRWVCCWPGQEHLFSGSDHSNSRRNVIGELMHLLVVQVGVVLT